jgi:hypothetical protein
MLPWERRQLQGGALKWWEKLYWGVFVVGISLILFNRIEWEKPPDPVGGLAVWWECWFCGWEERQHVLHIVMLSRPNGLGKVSSSLILHAS